MGWGHALFTAATTTVAVSACAFALGLAIGTLCAWAKLSGPAPLRRLAEVYGVVLRGIPDLLVIYLFYFGGRQVATTVAGLFGHHGPVEISGFAAGAIAIGLISGAGQTEVLRGAYQAISPGTLEAAKVGGMTRWTMFRRIIAPQALPTALPGLNNQWQSAIKESALVSVTGLVETMREVGIAAGSTELPFLFYAAGIVIYLIITSLSGLVFRTAEWRAMRSQMPARAR
ncbi:ABC transporter permease subunit [Acidisoma cellulosilytica]|uniref:ABC transporter permease subunit n=2 Tax=Acidisoma cellulosilyticum TaxID=2802395 RepID=A0A963Z472_9PROT|nr:ABC transporter permease subunit [Acidisoma cellulosilyticum]